MLGMRPGLEDDPVMNEDIKREFGHVQEGQDRIEKHLDQQDRHLSDHFKKFQQHTLDDQVMKITIEAHLQEHKEQNKHRWMIYSGIFLTAMSTLGLLVVEVVKHFFLRG